MKVAGGAGTLGAAQPGVGPQKDRNAARESPAARRRFGALRAERRRGPRRLGRLLRPPAGRLARPMRPLGSRRVRAPGRRFGQKRPASPAALAQPGRDARAFQRGAPAAAWSSASATAWSLVMARPSAHARSNASGPRVARTHWPIAGIAGMFNRRHGRAYERPAEPGSRPTAAPPSAGLSRPDIAWPDLPGYRQCPASRPSTCRIVEAFACAAPAPRA